MGLITDTILDSMPRIEPHTGILAFIDIEPHHHNKSIIEENEE